MACWSVKPPRCIGRPNQIPAESQLRAIKLPRLSFSDLHPQGISSIYLTNHQSGCMLQRRHARSKKGRASNPLPHSTLKHCTRPASSPQRVIPYPDQANSLLSKLSTSEPDHAVRRRKRLARLHITPVRSVASCRVLSIGLDTRVSIEASPLSLLSPFPIFSRVVVVSEHHNVQPSLIRVGYRRKSKDCALGSSWEDIRAGHHLRSFNTTTSYLYDDAALHHNSGLPGTPSRSSPTSNDQSQTRPRPRRRRH